MNLHVIRKALLCVSLLIALTAELTIFAPAACAQNYGAGPAAAFSPSPVGNAMSSDAYGTPAAEPTPAGTTSNSGQTQPNASLLAVPLNGPAPLTVDFYVGLANTPGPLVYQWNFGDGAVSLLPTGVYTLHVYQHPGTYLCSLELTNAQGLSTTVFRTITVKPSHG
jgi:PKD repeat protein